MNLEQVLKQNHSLVDVREPLECLLGKAKGAKNIPLREVSRRVDEFRQMEKPIVVYCRSGHRSGQAMKILQQYGIKEVYNAGGLSDVKKLQA